MTPAHAGAAMGELDAAFALGQQGFSMVIGPAGPGGHRLTASGFDIVAFNPTTGQVWIVDNKASGGTTSIQDASALTVNFRTNLADAIRQIRRASPFPHQATVIRHLENALTAVRAGRPLPSNVSRHITNAGGYHSGISQRLRDQGIRFLDLTGVATRRTRAADIRNAQNQGVRPGRPTTHPPGTRRTPGGGPPQTGGGRPTGPGPVVVPSGGGSGRGAAVGAGLTVALGGLNFVLNWLNDRQQQARVQERLRQLEPAIQAERERRRDHGILVLVHYHRVVAPPDSLIQPGAVFSHIQWEAGRSQDEARQNLARRSTINPGIPRGESGTSELDVDSPARARECPGAADSFSTRGSGDLRGEFRRSPGRPVGRDEGFRRQGHDTASPAGFQEHPGSFCSTLHRRSTGYGAIR